MKSETLIKKLLDYRNEIVEEMKANRHAANNADTLCLHDQKEMIAIHRRELRSRNEGLEFALDKINKLFRCEDEGEDDIFSIVAKAAAKRALKQVQALTPEENTND